MKFSELPYTRPDFAAYAEQLRKTTAALRAAVSYAEAREIFLREEKRREAEESMIEIAYVRHTANTLDPFYEAEMEYIDENEPALAVDLRDWHEAVDTSPFRAQFEAEFGKQYMQELHNSLRLTDSCVVEDNVKIGKVTQEYTKTAAACEVEFRGETCNFYGLLRHMQSTDRDERRAAMQAFSDLYESVSGALDDQYDRLIALRSGVAKKLGFSDYIALAYASRNRFDYTRADVARFRDEIRRVVTPACAVLYEEQRKRLGVDHLYFYDEEMVFPGSNPTPHDTTAVLLDKATEMYHGISEKTGEFFDFMRAGDMFDLETRKGKHLGGYCTYIASAHSPFIFSNFNGTSADIDVLTHEAGHAFEFYTAAKVQPLSDLTFSTSEVNEIHSMTMEHFAYPYMELFFGDRADDYRFLHLSASLKCLPYLCAVDEFQHRVFDEGLDAAGRRRAWHEIEAAYMPWRDYGDCAFLRDGGFWMQKQHIFLYPFYYVDYALAQICAYQLYRNATKDRDAAFAQYLKLCESGGSRGYFETLAYAGLENPFRAGTVERAVAPVLETLRAYKG